MKKQIELNMIEERIIYLNGEINNASSKDIIEQLLYLNAKDSKKDISLYINSQGGTVLDGLAIYDTINYIKCDVVTVCIGKCASMGAIILLSGKKGKRYALPNSEVMIHEVSSGTRGSVSVMEVDVTHSQKLNEKIKKIIAYHTNKKLKEIEKDIQKDKWLSASEAKEYGIVDDVIGTMI